MELVKIDKIKPNPKNPRVIKDNKFEQLKKSIQEFPEMLEKRPLVCFTDADGKFVVLGGNMRLKASKEVGLKELPVILADDWTEEQKNEFLIKDNVGFGEWDWGELANDWDAEKLEDWGLDLPKKSETEKLSKLQFEDVYYDPIPKPNIKLKDCVDFEIFNKKIEFIDNSKLSDEKKAEMKIFAQRFLRIDFENVANYYFFNADEEEKKVMERLRLVLCDSGLDGFIEDDLLKINETIEGWDEEK
jgi:hypothetical protein